MHALLNGVARWASVTPRSAPAAVGLAVFGIGLSIGVAAFAIDQRSAQARLPRVKLPPELARVLTEYETAWRNHDAAALASLFAEDGFILPNGAPPVRGRPAIQKAYANAGGQLLLHPFAFATEGGVGHILGGFSRQEGEPDVGKFTLTLRKGADGRWLIMSDMDNGNRPGR